MESDKSIFLKEGLIIYRFGPLVGLYSNLILMLCDFGENYSASCETASFTNKGATLNHFKRCLSL